MHAWPGLPLLPARSWRTGGFPGAAYRGGNAETAVRHSPLKGALQEKYPLFLSRIPAMVPAALADATLRTNPRPVDGAAIAQLLENLQ